MSEKKVTLKSIASGRKDRYDIDPRLIKRKPGFNVRINFGNMEELEQSIAEIGVTNPLKVYIDPDDQNPCLIDGDRRLTAVETLIKKGHDIKTVPCISGKWNEEERVIDMIVSGGSVPLNDLELGIAFIRLINFGYSQVEIGKKVGKNQVDVSNSIALGRASKRIQNMFMEDIAKKGAILGAIRATDDEDRQYELLLNAIPTTGRAKGRATLDGVRSQLDEKKQTPTMRMKTLVTWLKENENAFVGNERYGILQATVDYIFKGVVPLESMLIELSLAEKAGTEVDESACEALVATS